LKIKRKNKKWKKKGSRQPVWAAWAAAGPMLWNGYKLAILPIGPFHLHFLKYVKANEELWKLKYFSMQKYNLLKIL